MHPFIQNNRCMSDLNRWQEVIGPLHTVEGLAIRGFDVSRVHYDQLENIRKILGSPALIVLQTTDGVSLYPDGQFTPISDGGLQVRREVLEVWHDVLAPAILGGQVGEWRAGLMMFFKDPESGMSKADLLAKDKATAPEVARSLELELQELQ